MAVVHVAEKRGLSVIDTELLTSIERRGHYAREALKARKVTGKIKARVREMINSYDWHRRHGYDHESACRNAENQSAACTVAKELFVELIDRADFIACKRDHPAGKRF